MKKNRNMITKLVSVLLMIAMLVLSTEMTVIALADASDDVPSLTENVTAGNGEGEGTAKAEEITEPEPTEADLGTEVFEVVEYREANVKHFYMGDGTYQALTYPEAVHRKDANGTWQDIDNDLFLSTPISMYYQTKDARVRVAKNPATAQYLTRIAENGYEIKTSFLGISGNRLSTSNMPLNQFTTASVQNAEKTRILATDSNEIKFEKLSVVNNTSRVTYANLLNGVDVTYSLTGNTVKEDIVLNQPIEQNVFTFKLDLAGLVPTLEASGRILLADEESEETVYVIMAPYMIDATGAYSMDVYYELTEIKNGSYLLTVTADKDWLASSERAYPVTIDPTITSGSNCYDTYVSAAHPSVNFGTQPEAYVSMFEYTYIQIVHPVLPEGATMTLATLWLNYYYREVGDMLIGLCMLLEPFDETTLTYNSAIQLPEMGMLVPPFATKTLTHNPIYSHENPGRAYFDVYPLLEMWYEGWGYYGFVIRREAGSARIAFKTYESSNRQCAVYAIEYHMNSYPVQNGTYYIRNVDNGRYMQLNEQYAPSAENIPVHLQPFDGATNQKWTFEYLHNGYYKITSAASGKVLAISASGEGDDGVIPVQQEYGFTTRHQWKITVSLDGLLYRYYIQPRWDDEDLYLRADDEATVIQDDTTDEALWNIATRTATKTSSGQQIKTISFNVMYDDTYLERFGVDRVNYVLFEAFEFYYYNYALCIQYSSPANFTSYADLCNSNLDSICTCFGDTHKDHHTNIARNYEIVLQNDADGFVGKVIYFIGHGLCSNYNGNILPCADCSGVNHEYEDNVGAIALIGDYKTLSREINVVIHELGHFMGFQDHNTKDYINDEDYCLYGDAYDDDVQENRPICNVCFQEYYLSWWNSLT